MNLHNSPTCTQPTQLTLLEHRLQPTPLNGFYMYPRDMPRG